MKIFMAIAALALVVCGAQQAEAVDCNAVHNRCITDLEFDNTSAKTCVDVPTNNSCTAKCLYAGYMGGCTTYATMYNAQCKQTYNGSPPVVAGWKCSSFRGLDDADDSSKSVAFDEEANRDVCSGTGYCGWRSQVNRSPQNGAPQASRAKLHSCAVNGYSDEQYYGSSSSSCQGYASDTSINGFCDSTVWSSLCTTAGF